MVRVYILKILDKITYLICLLVAIAYFSLCCSLFLCQLTVLHLFDSEIMAKEGTGFAF